MHTNDLTSQPNKRLFAFCLFVFAGTLCLLYAGGLTTTIGAGMAFPDWPLSNGSINPEGWVEDPAMRAEHGHRLLGAFVGSMMLIMYAWTRRAESRTWVKKLTVFALILVIIQGLLGGIRVLAVDVNFAIPHAMLAQIFLCTLATITLSHTQLWSRSGHSAVDAPIGSKITRPQQLSALIVLTTLLQLAVAAVMRHHGAGLAIQSFPQSTASGLWLPEAWPFAISIHFTHRVLALLLTVLVGLYCWRLWRLSQQSKQALWRTFAYLLGSLITVQILLGASVIWTLKRFPLVTTLHVIVGALFLTCLWLSLVLLRKAHPSNSVHT